MTKLAATAAAIAVAVAVAASWLLLAPPPCLAAEPRGLFPAATETVVSVDLESLAKTPLWQELFGDKTLSAAALSFIPEEGRAALAEDPPFLALIEQALNSVKRVTLAARESKTDDDPYHALLLLHSDLPQPQLVKLLKKLNSELTSQRVGDYLVLRIDGFIFKFDSVQLGDGLIAVVPLQSSPESFDVGGRSVIDRHEKKTPPTLVRGLVPLVDELEQGAFFAWAASGAEVNLLPAVKIARAKLSIAVRNEIVVESRLYFLDEAEALANTDRVRTYFQTDSDLKNHSPADAELFKLFDKIAKTISVTQSGNAVDLKLTIPASMAAAVYRRLAKSSAK